jgi:large subunit ribosomal protein L23
MSSTTKSPYQIIVAPIVTEKTMRGSDVDNTVAKKYTFSVARNANKFEIKWAIEQIQQEIKQPVNVTEVHTYNVRGKARNGRFMRKANRGTTSAWKKAVITLQLGQEIQIIEGV